MTPTPNTPNRNLKGGAAVLAIAAGLVAAWEGTRTHAYYDSIGVATICVGHTHGVHIGDVATPAQCQAALRGDLGVALAMVNTCIKAPITDNQRAALTSAVFNIGPKVACGSSIQRFANAGAPASAWCPRLMAWVYAGGVRLQGLANRRAAEVKLCLKGA